jgi:response regulator RpfG family c-di-GMP phosphodiesterase
MNTTKTTPNQLETIMHYSELIANEKDYSALEGLLCEFSKALTGAERATIWFCDEKAFSLWTSTADGIGAHTIPMDKGIAGYAVMNELPVMSNDAHHDPRFYDEIEKDTGYETKNTIVVPIKNPNDETVGALQVLNKNGGNEDFTNDDMRLVTFAVNFATSILNVIYLNYRINTIFDYTAKIADETDTDKLLMLLADMGRDILKADRATLWLHDEDRNILWTRVAHGVSRLEITTDNGIAGAVFTNERSLIVNDPYNDARFHKEVDARTGYKTKSIIAILLRSTDGKKIGVFQCVNKIAKKSEFKSIDMSRMKMIGGYMAGTLELAKLYSEIEETQKEIIATMGEAGEFRSRETGNHVKRVAKYSSILAKLIGMSDEEAALIEMASPMHDIGKIAIPDAILNKPGKLDFEEFEIMKTHAAIGHEILSHSKRKIIQAAAIVAGEHHEKWDGSGYPKGTSGEEIHIYGRITAIADVFDALGSDRCYKKAWELDRILELFKNESGKHFDPKLTELFFTNLDKFLEVRDSLRDV